MIRKTASLLRTLYQPLVIVAFILSANILQAQPFYQVTTISGSQSLGGKTVTISNFGGGFVSGLCANASYSISSSTTPLSYFLYSFSAPVYFVRIQCIGIDAGMDVLNFKVNNNAYPLNYSMVSLVPYACGNNRQPLITSAGDLTTDINTPGANRLLQVDIKPGIPINSVEITHVGPSNTASYNFYFADTAMVINEPYQDTLKCPGDSLYLPFTSYAPFNTGNIFTAQLSNAAGSFASPTNIGMLSATGNGIISAKLPQNIAAGTGYRVRIVSSNPVRTSAANDSNIHILAGPSVIPVATATTPCAGSTLNLSSTNAGAGVSYNWTGPNSYTTTGQTPNIINAQTSHSGDYIVTASIGSCSRKDTVTALVKPLPAVPTLTNNGPLCPGDSLGLAGTNTTSGVSYSWIGPGSFSSSLQNPYILNVTSSHSGVYILTTSLSGCSTIAQTSVVIKPVPAIPTANSNSPVCAGGSLNLNANSVTGGVSYNWNGPNGYVSTIQNPTINPAGLSDAGNYTVTATLNGCTSAAANTSVIINNIASLGAYPSPNDTVCQMNPAASLVAVPFNGGSSPQFQWFKNGNPVPGATALSYATTGITQGDTFYCRMTSTGICAGPLVLYSPKIGLTVLQSAAPPIVNVSVSPGTLLSPWQMVTFAAVASGNSGTNPQYQWKRNGSNIIGATSSTWSANNLADNDEISCVVTSNAWCADPASVESNKTRINIKTAVHDVTASRYKLYPNPVANELTIEGESGMQVSILNLLGQELYKHVLGTSKEVINISQLTPGHYLLQLKDNDGGRSLVKLERL